MRAGGVAWGPALAALGGALALQIGANFANDVFDAEHGADGADRIGPVRAVAAGLISRVGDEARDGRSRSRSRWRSACTSRASRGWPVVAIGLASIAAAIAYTGGPWPLGYHGLGDVFVFAFFGVVAVCGTAFVQLGHVPALALWASAAGRRARRPRSSSSTTCAIARATRAPASARSRCGSAARAGIAEYALLVALAYAIPLALARRHRRARARVAARHTAARDRARARARACGRRARSTTRCSRRPRSCCSYTARCSPSGSPSARVGGHEDRRVSRRGSFAGRSTPRGAAPRAVARARRADRRRAHATAARPGSARRRRCPACRSTSSPTRSAAAEALAARVPFAIETPAHATGIADRVTTAPAARFALETALLSAIAQHARTSIASLWSRTAARRARGGDRRRRRTTRRSVRSPAARAASRSRPSHRDRARRARIARAARRACGCASTRTSAGRAPKPGGWLASLAALPIDFVEEPCVDTVELLARSPALPDRARREPGHAWIARCSIARSRRRTSPRSSSSRRCSAGSRAASSSPRSRIAAASRRSHRTRSKARSASRRASSSRARSRATSPVGLGPHRGARAILGARMTRLSIAAGRSRGRRSTRDHHERDRTLTFAECAASLPMPVTARHRDPRDADDRDDPRDPSRARCTRVRSRWFTPSSHRTSARASSPRRRDCPRRHGVRAVHVGLDRRAAWRDPVARRDPRRRGRECRTARLARRRSLAVVPADGARRWAVDRRALSRGAPADRAARR